MFYFDRHKQRRKVNDIAGDGPKFGVVVIDVGEYGGNGAEYQHHEGFWVCPCIEYSRLVHGYNRYILVFILHLLF